MFTHIFAIYYYSILIKIIKFMFNLKKSVSMSFIVFGICGLFFATKTQAETGNPDLTVTGNTFGNNRAETVNPTVTSDAVDKTIKATVQTTEAAVSANRLYDEKLSEILAELKQSRDIDKEQATKIKYLKRLTNNVEKLPVKMETAINSFITYGVDTNTQKLGAGERAAVMYSYKNAFNKLPETEAELADVVKIASGRWPSITNQDAENKAKEQFQKIYKRVADMNNANDNAAVTVMAYGLRQKAENRNLNSETAGIKIFKDIYGHTPSSTEDWNIMQAITYSGASR